jgi:polyketide cyclase/dehydrase/lipid transport protein
MRTVRVTQMVAGTVDEVERRWYDTGRWSSWVDGVERVLDVSGPWPKAGARVTWQSGPAGRGRVVERVVEHQPLRGQTSDVSDPSIRGRQSVAFAAAGDGVEVTLTLSYELQRRSPVTPVVDLLFIRRAMASSLQTTLARFAHDRGA